MKTLKTCILLFTILLFLSCQKESYFEFDEVEYYFKDVTVEDTFKITLKEKKNNDDEDFLKIVEGNSPKIVSEEYSSRLLKFGYIKKTIDKTKNEQLNDIFSENNCKESIAASCIPKYRDIFIFKKNNKTVGIAKICFDCRLFHIVGTNKNLENFGQCGDFEKLERLIK